jgi:hypothetical protein
MNTNTDLGLIRLGLDLPTFDGRNSRMTGTLTQRVHLVTDVNDDGSTLCGQTVAEVGKAAVRFVPNAQGRPWSTSLCTYCSTARREVELRS